MCNKIFTIFTEKNVYLNLYLYLFLSRNLGGKLGQQVVEQLHVENMGDLLKFSEKVFQQLLGDKNGYEF